MAVYKRGKTYWYEFQFNGERIQQSAQTANRDTAQQIEAADRVRLATGDAGIEKRPEAPTLREFSTEFMNEIRMGPNHRGQDRAGVGGISAALLREKG
jgi:hypothetical protein